MNAQEALKITQKNWSENYDKYIQYTIGYQNKVEDAAKSGRSGCPLGLVPQDALDFVSNFFEEMGYYVIIQNLNPNTFLVWLNWKNFPNNSRSFYKTEEMKEIEKMLSEIGLE